MREQRIEDWLTSKLSEAGFLHLKINVMGRRGWPDHFYFGFGRVFLIEYKAPGEKPRPLQDYVIRQLLKRFIKVFVVDTLEAARELLDIIIGLTRPVGAPVNVGNVTSVMELNEVPGDTPIIICDGIAEYEVIGVGMEIKQGRVVLLIGNPIAMAAEQTKGAMEYGRSLNQGEVGPRTDN